MLFFNLRENRQGRMYVCVRAAGVDKEREADAKTRMQKRKK